MSLLIELHSNLTEPRWWMQWHRLCFFLKDTYEKAAISWNNCVFDITNHAWYYTHLSALVVDAARSRVGPTYNMPKEIISLLLDWRLGTKQCYIQTRGIEKRLWCDTRYWFGPKYQAIGYDDSYSSSIRINSTTHKHVVVLPGIRHMRTAHQPETTNIIQQQYTTVRPVTEFGTMAFEYATIASLCSQYWRVFHCVGVPVWLLAEHIADDFCYTRFSLLTRGFILVIPFVWVYYGLKSI